MTSKSAWWCAFFLLAGCAPKPVPPPAPPSGPFHVTWQMKNVPRSLDIVPVMATVTNAVGRPVAGANVSVTLSMPSMPMPDNKASLRETGPGTYTGTVRFTMSGNWLARVTATKDKAQGAQTFPVTVQ